MNDEIFGDMHKAHVFGNRSDDFMFKDSKSHRWFQMDDLENDDKSFDDHGESPDEYDEPSDDSDEHSKSYHTDAADVYWVTELNKLNEIEQTFVTGGN